MSEDLLHAHTVPAPRMSASEAEARVLALSKQPGEAAARTAEIRDALLSYLAYRFTPVNPDELADDGDHQAAIEACGQALKLSEPSTQRRFVEEIVMNLAHPADHRFFAPTLRKLIAPPDMDAVLLQHLRDGNDLHARNVLALIPYLFVDGYASRVGKQLLDLAKQIAGDPARAEETREQARLLSGGQA